MTGDGADTASSRLSSHTEERTQDPVPHSMHIHVMRFLKRPDDRIIHLMFRIQSRLWSCWHRGCVDQRTPVIRVQTRGCRACDTTSDRDEKGDVSVAGQDDTRGQLVYEGCLTRQVRAVKWLSLSTSCMGLALQCVVYLKLSSTTSQWVTAFASSIATIILLSPLLLHLITRRYVTHLYYDPKSRMFTTYNLTLFNGRRCTRFRADDVVTPTISSALTTFTVFRKPYFIDPLAFKDLSIFEHLVGYDKLDQKLRSTGTVDEDLIDNQKPQAQADQSKCDANKTGSSKSPS